MTSCNNDKKPSEVKTTTKEHMDAGTKTIENMQSAYKGEKTATAKYEAFSKKRRKRAITTLHYCTMRFQQLRTFMLQIIKPS